jgi:hypothetical protein
MEQHNKCLLFCSRLQQGLQDKGYEEWVGEMIGMREILRQFANISKSDVVGMRAPYLKPGRNTQYEVSENMQLDHKYCIVYGCYGNNFVPFHFIILTAINIFRPVA